MGEAKVNARSLSFTIPGRIGGKGRPRAFLRGGHIRMHTPAKTESQEAVVRQMAALAMRGKLPMTGPLGLQIVVIRNYPKSWSKSQRGQQWVTGKPDCDNIIKLIGDALNGIAYGDDSQIAQLMVSRRYDGVTGEEVRVCIMELS